MAPPKRAADGNKTALKRDNRAKKRKSSATISNQAVESKSVTGGSAGGAGKTRKGGLLRNSGMWVSTGGDKPSKTWVDGLNLARLEVDALNLRSPVLDGEDEAKISTAYEDLWLRGKSQAFTRKIYSLYLDRNSAPLPAVGFIQVWRCLSGQLVSKEETWNGLPDHNRLSNSDNALRIAKCVFQVITRGRYFDKKEGVILEFENGTSFADFRSLTLEQDCRYPPESLDLLLASLNPDESKRPTRESILDYCDSVLRPTEGTYMPRDLRIPTGLRNEEGAVYEHILKVLDIRHTKNVHIPQIVTVTDINKDVDDLVAMVLLKELHRLGLIELRGFVANLHPAKKRALAGRGALDALGLRDIPIGVGTEAEVVEVGKEPRIVYPYEFEECPFMAPEDTQLPEGKDLLVQLCRTAQENNEKLTFLLISGLRDMNDFIHSHPDLLKDNAERIVLQGGYRVEQKDGKEQLIADTAAANNNFDIAAAQEFHEYMAIHQIPSIAYTKVATFATPIPEQLLIDLEQSGHKIGIYLHKAQVEMDLAFYEQACSPNPKERFRDFMDQDWYLNNKSSYYQTPHPEGSSLPVGEEVIKYFNKLVAYDALAALASGGDDLLDELGISLSPGEPKPLHRIIGVAGQPERAADPEKGTPAQPAVAKDPGINGEAMAQAIRALVRGSLLASQQNLSSNPRIESDIPEG